MTTEQARVEKTRWADEADRLPILMVTHEFFPTRGGVAVYVHELADAAAKQGHDVHVLAPGHPRWRELDLPVKLEAMFRAPLLAEWWYFPATAAYLVANRRALRDQTLHLCQQGPLRVVMVLAFLRLVRPKRLVITLHGSELLQLSKSRLGGRWFLGKLLETSDRVAVLSRWVREELLRYYPTLDKKVVVAPGAPRTGGQQVNSRSESDDARITVLTVGRIHPRKGQHTILKAFARMDSARRARVRYVIVGPTVDRAYERSLKQMAEFAGLDVVFVGEVDDATLSRCYAEADIFAMTSGAQADSVEGFGLAYLDASANALPIVGYRTGGVEDAVRHGVTGLLLELGDVDGVAAALSDLIEDPSLRLKLGSNGRDWAKSLSWDQCAKVVYGNLY